MCEPPLHIVFENPVIPSNTGNAIRLAACTGAHLHLIEPLGFSLEDKYLRRAGLDYHDLADLSIHPDLDSCFEAIGPSNVYAFTGHVHTWFTDISYQPGDTLLFGTEPTGLTNAALNHPRVTTKVRIPMLPSRRSLNLANSAAIAVYEAWRQIGFSQGV